MLVPAWQQAKWQVQAKNRARQFCAELCPGA
jgi:hypothetical protein